MEPTFYFDILFLPTDSQFANALLNHSKQLYDFAKNHHGFYSESVTDAASFYK